jgi:hypothetical protein
MPFALNPNGWVAGPGVPDGAGVADAAGGGGVATGADAVGSSDGDEAGERLGATDGDGATDVALPVVALGEAAGRPAGLAPPPAPAGALELPQAAIATATIVVRNAFLADRERRDWVLRGRQCTGRA